MTTAIDNAISKRLADRGVRYTSGRRQVVTTLVTADGPLSAHELATVLGSDLPLSTIYRTLAVLSEADVLTPHLATKGLARYELAEWLTGHHHHLVCIECGGVEDVEVAPKQEAAVEQLVAAIAETAGFTATNHALEIEGRCARCT